MCTEITILLNREGDKLTKFQDFYRILGILNKIAYKHCVAHIWFFDIASMS